MVRGDILALFLILGTFSIAWSNILINVYVILRYLLTCWINSFPFLTSCGSVLKMNKCWLFVKFIFPVYQDYHKYVLCSTNMINYIMWFWKLNQLYILVINLSFFIHFLYMLIFLYISGFNYLIFVENFFCIFILVIFVFYYFFIFTRNTGL